MDQQHDKISLYLAICILVLSTGLTAHVMAIPVIFNVAQRDAWISVIIAAPFFIGWLFLFFHVINRLNGQNLIEWTKQHWGKWVAGFVQFILLVFVCFSGFYTLLDTSMWAIASYIQQTPLILISALTMICVFLAVLGGLQSIAIVSGIILPIVTFLGFFVSFANDKYKDWSLLLPSFERGFIPPLHGSFYVISSLMELWIIILFSHRIKTKLKKGQTFLLALYLLMIVIGPITGSITEFGEFEALKQRHPAFDQWKIVSLGIFLQHVDFLSIFQWLSGAFVRISIYLFLFVEMLPFRTRKNRIYLFTFTCFLMVASVLLPWREDLMLAMLQYIYYPILVTLVLLLTIAVVITQSIIKRREKN